MGKDEYLQIRKVFLAIFILWIVPVHRGYAMITLEEAKAKAQSFLSNKSMTRSIDEGLTLAQGDIGYYAFNIGKDNGFVIVSSNERTNEIIGYSHQGSFDLNSMPIGMRHWMKSYSRTISNLPSSSRQVVHKQREAVPTLIQTYWDQSGVYARYCPTVKNPDDPNSPEYSTPSGCVATAMAQIINYYQWPKSLPALPEYTTSSLGIFRPALPSESIDYDILRPRYFWDDDDESVNEINKLLIYCGQSCQMDYRPDGSGAGFTVETMSKYWGYTKKARSVNRSSYSTVDAWEDDIYNEIAAGHPVPYAGMNYLDGHQFICDGYDGHGFFHLNFGWQGAEGFFDLSLCDVYYADSNEYISDNGYVSEQRAILGLIPTETDETGVEIEYDTRQSINGEIRVNSIEPIGISHVPYFSMVKINVTGLSDIEQCQFYVISDDGFASKMTVYLKKDETRDVYVHVRCVKEGSNRVIISSDQEGTQVLAESSFEGVISDEQNQLSSQLEFPDMVNGVIPKNYIKACVTIVNSNDKRFEDDYRVLLLISHPEDKMNLEYRVYNTIVSLDPNEQTTIEVVFGNLKNAQYLVSTSYWSSGSLMLDSKSSQWVLVNGSSDNTSPITIGKSGKASYCGDKSLDFSFSDEVKAYIATGFDKDEGTIWLTRVKDVPAGVPILIKGEADKTYDVPVTDSQNSYYTNMFVGNTSGEKMVIQETDGDMMNYYLSGDGTFKSVNKTANIGTNKCYLQLPGTFNATVTGATQTVKIGSIGKASFAAPVDLDFTNVSGLKAFTATGYDKSTKTIWLTRVMKVQKGEGVLLKGDAKDYTIPSSAVQSSYKNMFIGNTSGDEIQVQETSEDGSQTNYYLSAKDGSFVSVNGFAKIGDNKCYLALPTSMVAVSSTRSSEDSFIFEEPEMIKLPINFRSLDNDGDGTTSIKDLTPALSEGEGAWFTLQGQRVAKPGKGLYIKNGKVVIVR